MRTSPVRYLDHDDPVLSGLHHDYSRRAAFAPAFAVAYKLLELARVGRLVDLSP